MAFITLEQYKNYAEIKSTEGDRKIEGLITRVEEIIKNYCGIKFVSATYTEDLNADGYYVFLTQMPVTSVTSVQYYDIDGTLQTIASTEYRIYAEESVLELTDTAVALIATSKYINKQVRVVYVAGYSTIPDDIKQVTMDLVKYYDKGEYTPLSSNNVRTIDYDVMESVSLPPHIRRILAFYRKIE
jgi:hypothetical protein